MDFVDEMHTHVLPGDAAFGAAASASGLPPEICQEELCATSPETVRQVHAEYLAAGARVLRTNSFGGSRIGLAQRGCARGVGEVNWLAAQLATDAAKGSSAFVAASIGPVALSPEQLPPGERRAIFEEQMGALLDGGARLVFLERFNDLEELLIAVEVKHSLHHCPVIASFNCLSNGRMSDGTALADAFSRLRAADADYVGVNCARPREELLAAINEHDAEGVTAAYISEVGAPLSADAFATSAHALVRAGARLIGGGPGIGPAHIAAFTKELAAIAQ